MAMRLPWKSMTDEQLVAHCRQRAIERAWEQFGERYGCHLVAGTFVAWFAYSNRPIPWFGYFAIVCLYFFSALIAAFFVFLVPAGARTLPFAWELDRRHSLSSFRKEVRKARRLFESEEPPDWIVLVHSEGMGWTWTRLTLFALPPRGRREHRSGPCFGVIRDPAYNPLEQLVREDRVLNEQECRASLEVLRTLDLNGVVDVNVHGCDIHHEGLAVLRRDPATTRNVRFCRAALLIDPEQRGHPTFRLVSLVIKLPGERCQEQELRS
jgi:hypothetical protein